LSDTTLQVVTPWRSASAGATDINPIPQGLSMNPPRPARAPKAKSLAQQQTDFTSEGSPPPGLVAASVPAMPDKPDKSDRAVSHALWLLAQCRARPGDS
jgi:hypothetical protein